MTSNIKCRIHDLPFTFYKLMEWDHCSIIPPLPGIRHLFSIQIIVLDVTIYNIFHLTTLKHLCILLYYWDRE